VHKEKIMDTIYLPHSEVCKVEHSSKNRTELIGAAKLVYYLIGQGWVQDLLKPTLDELHLDKERFFKAFWENVEKIALND
jgi:hypothetical protein